MRVMRGTYPVSPARVRVGSLILMRVERAAERSEGVLIVNVPSVEMGGKILCCIMQGEGLTMRGTRFELADHYWTRPSI